MSVFSPLHIGSLKLPNRLLMAPVKTGFGGTDGLSTYRHDAYYRRRAEGGVGAIILEPCYVDRLGKEHPKQLGISEYEHLDGLKRLVAAIHEGGSLAIAHLNHGGRAANPKASGATPEAPSEVTCALTGVSPVAMSPDRIDQVVREFAGAARRAAEAGFDAIEIQFGLGYLIAQFLSPRTNQRTDQYGGTVENRLRFAGNVLRAVAFENSRQLPVIARMSASEQCPGGLDINDAMVLARFLQINGVAALHVVSGSVCDSPPWYFQHMRLPLGKNLDWASLIKMETHLPVIVAGRLGDPDDIRHTLDNNMVDAIALGRPLVADPDLPLKMRENRDYTVIQCGACLQGCLGGVRSGQGLTCIVNPEVGCEANRTRPAGKPRKVVVIGAGPAGMQAALSAYRLGHQVILFEKHEYGGQANLSWLPPGKSMMQRPLTSLKRLIGDSDIDVRIPETATVQRVLDEYPDQVIIATGATPIIPSIPGLTDPLTGEDVLTARRSVGQRVLVIGGAW